jgi:type IX secretion system PorP/SprF family membrane protein
MKKLILIFIGILTAGASALAQDIHFSQYTETPSLVNPALTGTQYVMRASVIYKDQWSSVTVPYRTLGASFEMKFKASNWEKVDAYKTNAFKKSFSRLAGGLSFFSDKAGDGSMGTNQVMLSLASFIRTGKNSTFSVGLQGGVVQKSVNYSKFIFSNQYTGTGYDPTVASGENFDGKNFIYPDFAAGACWNYGKEEKSIGENNVFRANVGASIFHISQPSQNFLAGSGIKLYSKIIVHGQFLIGIPHSNVALAPSYLLQFQGPQKEMLLGFMVKYYLKDDSKYTGYVKRSSLGLGLLYRNKDALVAQLLLEMGQYAVGVTYDLNTSGLKKVSTLRGGPEITIRFNSGNPYLFQKR